VEWFKTPAYKWTWLFRLNEDYDFDKSFKKVLVNTVMLLESTFTWLHRDCIMATMPKSFIAFLIGKAAANSNGCHQ